MNDKTVPIFAARRDIFTMRSFPSSGSCPGTTLRSWNVWSEESPARHVQQHLPSFSPQLRCATRGTLSFSLETSSTSRRISREINSALSSPSSRTPPSLLYIGLNGSLSFRSFSIPWIESLPSLIFCSLPACGRSVISSFGRLCSRDRISSFV